MDAIDFEILRRYINEQLSSTPMDSDYNQGMVMAFMLVLDMMEQRAQINRLHQAEVIHPN